MLRFRPEERMTAEELCQQPKIMYYIKQQNLPGPRVCSFFVSSQIVKSNQDYPVIQAQITKCVHLTLEKYH